MHVILMNAAIVQLLNTQMWLKCSLICNTILRYPFYGCNKKHSMVSSSQRSSDVPQQLYVPICNYDHLEDM